MKSPSKFRPLTEAETEEVITAPLDAGSDLAAGAPDAAHLDAVTVEEPEGTALDPMGDGAAPVVISKDDFHALFCGVFGIASEGTKLRSLKVESADPKARSCTEAIYDIAEETPALRFLIEPGSVWLQRACAIGLFIVPMGVGVANELRAKKAAEVVAKRRLVNAPPDGAAPMGEPLVELP